MKLYYKNESLGNITTNHSLTIDEAIKLRGIDVNAVDEHGDELYPDFEEFKLIDIEAVIDELVAIEKDPTAHGNTADGEINWEDGCESDSYEEYIKDYAKQEYSVELDTEDVLEIWKAVKQAIA